MKITSLIYRLSCSLWNIFPFKHSVAHLIKWLKLPIRKFQRDLWFAGSFKVPYFSSYFKLYSSKNDYSAIDVFWEGLQWDAKSLEVWGKLAQKSTVILDIGSNIGLYALAAKCVNKNSQVYAFEPAKKILKLLKRNIHQNQYDITVAPIALSNTEGETDFFDFDRPTAIASLKLNENLASTDQLVKYKVPITTFKSFFQAQQLERIDLISIDVEMNEPEVLEGMGDLIERFKPNFIIEILNDSVGQKVEAFFHNLGYSYFQIDEIDGLIERQHLKRDQPSDAKHRGFNFLICNAEDKALIMNN